MERPIYTVSGLTPVLAPVIVEEAGGGVMQKVIWLLVILSCSGIGFIGVQIVRGKGRLALISTVVLGIFLVLYDSYLEEETDRGIARHIYCFAFPCRPHQDQTHTDPNLARDQGGVAPPATPLANADNSVVANAFDTSPDSSTMATPDKTAAVADDGDNGSQTTTPRPTAPIAAPALAREPGELAAEWSHGRIYGSDNEVAGLMPVRIAGRARS